MFPPVVGNVRQFITLNKCAVIPTLLDTRIFVLRESLCVISLVKEEIEFLEED